MRHEFNVKVWSIMGANIIHHRGCYVHYAVPLAQGCSVEILT